jgi:hypothetical protein
MGDGDRCCPIGVSGAAMNVLVPVDKIAKCVRLLGSDQPGEVIAAVFALRRSLEGAGVDLHWLAERIEAQPSTAKLMPYRPNRVWSWQNNLLACERHLRSLDPREADFVSTLLKYRILSISDRKYRGYEPSPKQISWLSAIAARLRRQERRAA